jgi:hypothetical protein
MGAARIRPCLSVLTAFVDPSARRVIEPDPSCQGMVRFLTKRIPCKASARALVFTYDPPAG